MLVGVDGSSNSLATVAFVGRLLSVEHDEIILAYVAPPLPFLGRWIGSGRRHAGPRRCSSSAVFDEAVLRLPGEWQSRVERVELSGSPGAGLLEAADQKGAELIAVGFRGTGLFEQFLLGSVSRAVVQTARVPVLVVKTTGGPESEKIAGTPDGTFRALAAYDGSEFGERIAALTGKLTWPDGARGWVMTVVPPMFVHQLPTGCSPCNAIRMCRPWRRPGRRSTTFSSSRPSAI